MQWKSSLLAAVFLAAHSYAMLRFGCTQLVTERLDPLVTPGIVGTPHVHQIIGGNAFNATMAPETSPSDYATCTTCEYAEDFSNYWTAVLYFQHPNGSFKRVPQITGLVGNNEPNSWGVTLYYTQGDFHAGVYSKRKVTPFKKGFRMLTGDPFRRTQNTNADELPSSTFRCFDARRSQFSGGTYPGGGVSAGYDTYNLPNKKCSGGIRSQIYFPTCWDGKNLDSPDHKSHVAYPKRGGSCPTTHPTVMPQLLYEFIWDTGKFDSMWPTDGKNPFVFSMGDRTGYGQHGDYLFGWKADSFEKAMSQCDNGFDAGAGARPCAALKQQTYDVNKKCTLSSKVGEDVGHDGWLNSLPGNPVIDPSNFPTLVPNQPPPPTQPAPVPTQQPTLPPPVVPTQQPQPPPPAPPGTVPKFGQCGGLGWAGATTCQAGTTCQALNDFYHQCL